jgi:ferredoxin-NADP reductase
VVPFLSMLGHHRATGDARPVRLLYSARTVDDVIGRVELEDQPLSVEVAVTLTRGAPAGWTGLAGRVGASVLVEHTVPPARTPNVLVCGPTGFVETVAGALIDLGHDPSRIKTERFGASGGS